MDQYLEMYNNSKNPLEDNETLEKVINAYILGGIHGSYSFYREIVKIGTEGKTSDPPPMEEKDMFWSALFNKWKRNILYSHAEINYEKYEGHFNELLMILKDIPDISTYDELCNILEMYPVISEYGILPAGDRLWNYVLSRDVNGTKRKDINPKYRLYINSEASDTYQIIAGFLGKCIQRKLPYDLKFIDYPEDYKDRADSIVIWADEKTLFQYIEILDEIKEKAPNLVSRCGEPPILTMKLNDWVGFGEEPNEGSYTTARIELLMNSINMALQQWIIENEDKKINYRKTNFSVKQYITAKGIKKEFDIIKSEIKRNPRLSKRYGIEIDELDKKMYTQLCCELVDEVIPIIKSNNYTLSYNKDGRHMFFDFTDAIYEILGMASQSDVDKENIYERIRSNIKLNAKQHDVDAEKFIYNDDYLTSIKEKER